MSRFQKILKKIFIFSFQLVYSLRHYYGDERIKSFIWDLVNPENDGQDCRNHSGLSAPVPRGRKGQKAKREAYRLAQNLESQMGQAAFDPERDIYDEGYKKHLKRHSNK